MATININFDAPSPAPLAGYNIRYRAFGAADYITLSPNPTASPVSIPGVADGTTYEGIIRSDCGDGLYSTEVPFVVTGNVVIPNFDFLVARYYWAPGEGTDLDTLTGFTNTGIPGIDNNWVGWNQGYVVPGDGGPTPEIIDPAAYLQSAGDNTGTGAEAVLMSLNKITTDNPSVPNVISINMYAFWYGSRASGNALFEIIAYKGGNMTKVGYEFANNGGSEVFRQTFTKNVPSVIKTSNPSTSTLLGIVNFNKTTKQAELILQ